MLSIAPASSKPSEGILDASVGFAWWYADLIDARGDGLVLIWSWGLPFLPGQMAAARAGRGTPARRRPSLNLCTYQGGKPALYLLQEYLPDEVRWDGEHTWWWGDSRIERHLLPEGASRLVADLDCPLPGTSDRLRAQVEIEGPDRIGGPVADPASSHQWAPVLGPSAGRATLRAGRWRQQLAGTGYHDRNSADRRIDALGFRRWVWGRAVIEGQLLIWYLLWPTSGGPAVCHLLRIDAAGLAHPIDGIRAVLGPRGRGRWGLPGWPSVTLAREGQPWLEIERTAVWDEGPFYRRVALRVRRPGGGWAPGVGELCEPDRIDRWHRVLVQMCLHRPAGPNSVWLPLFSGPPQGRPRRLLASALGTTGQPRVGR